MRHSSRSHRRSISDLIDPRNRCSRPSRTNRRIRGGLGRRMLVCLCSRGYCGLRRIYLRAREWFRRNVRRGHVHNLVLHLHCRWHPIGGSYVGLETVPVAPTTTSTLAAPSFLTSATALAADRAKVIANPELAPHSSQGQESLSITRIDHLDVSMNVSCSCLSARPVAYFVFDCPVVHGDGGGLPLPAHQRDRLKDILRARSNRSETHTCGCVHASCVVST
jgi:hypothetical protein